MPAFVPFRCPALRRRRPGAGDRAAVRRARPTPTSTRCEARSEHNIARVDVPRGGRRPLRPGGRRCCERGADDGVLVADDQPSFTIYRMRFTDASGAARDIAGVLGGLEIVDEGAGGVLPHERTTPKASTDRLDLTRATASEPVPGLGTVAGLRAHRAARRARRAGRPRWLEDGVEHVVERVTDRRSDRRDPAGAGRRRRAHRRRPPPLQHQPHLPRRGPRGDRSTRRRRPSRRWPSSASWSPSSSAWRRSTGCTPTSRRPS